MLTTSIECNKMHIYYIMFRYIYIKINIISFSIRKNHLKLEKGEFHVKN